MCVNMDASKIMAAVKSKPAKIAVAAAAAFAVAGLLVAGPMGKERADPQATRVQEQYSQKRTVGSFTLYAGAECKTPVIGPVEISTQQRATRNRKEAEAESDAAAATIAQSLKADRDVREPMEELCASADQEQKACMSATISEVDDGKGGKEKKLMDMRKKGRLSDICDMMGIEREFRVPKTEGPANREI